MKTNPVYKYGGFVALSFILLLLFIVAGAPVVGAFTNPTQSPPSGTPGPLPITDGGTGASTTAGALSNLGAAEAGANTSITSLTPYTGNPVVFGSAGIKFNDGTVQTTAASANQWSSTSTGIYYNGGDVGVGTANPGHKVDVAGNLNLNNGIASGQALFVNGKEALWSNGTYFSWGYANSYNYFADPIAIGSSVSPLTPLEITKSTGTGTEGDLLRLNAVNGGGGSGSGILFTNNNDVLQLARIAGLDSGNWGGGLAFYTSPGTGSSPGGTPTERMFINDSGQVGIGTTSMIATLDVVGPSTGSGITLYVGGGGDLVLASGGSLFFDGNYSYASGNYIKPNGGANTQDFFTGGTQRLGISNSGVAVSNGSLTLNGNNINDVAGGVGIGNVSTGWYSDTNNLSARFPGGSSGCFYVQNASGGTTYMTSGLCDNGGTDIQGLLTAGANMPGGNDEFHITNTTGNAYLYAYSTAGSSATIGAWSGSGGVPLILGGSGVTINGVTKSNWPGSLAARNGFGSGNSTVYQNQYVTISSIAFTLNNPSTIIVSEFTEDAYASVQWGWTYNGSSCTATTESGGDYPISIGIELDGSTYTWGEASGASYTVNSSDILPNIAAGSHTLSLVAYNTEAAPDASGCPAVPVDWGTGSLSYTAL